MGKQYKYYNDGYSLYSTAYLDYFEMTVAKLAAEKAAAKEKMEAKNKKYWMIVNVSAGNLCSTGVRPGGRYESEFDALADAETYAKNNPGLEYAVVQAVTRSFVEKTPAITTRLA